MLQRHDGKTTVYALRPKCKPIGDQKNSDLKWPPRRLQKLQSIIVPCTGNLRGSLEFPLLFYVLLNS